VATEATDFVLVHQAGLEDATASSWVPISEILSLPSGNGGADAPSFLWNQPTASDTWPITHGLGYYPAVTIIDTAGTVLMGTLSYPDLNTLVISFSAAFAGSATLV
jgi:hypothetical protein